MSWFSSVQRSVIFFFMAFLFVREKGDGFVDDVAGTDEHDNIEVDSLFLTAFYSICDQSFGNVIHTGLRVLASNIIDYSCGDVIWFTAGMTCKMVTITGLC